MYLFDCFSEGLDIGYFNKWHKQRAVRLCDLIAAVVIEVFGVSIVKEFKQVE